MPLAYNPHAVCSKLSREQPPAALARRCKKVDAPVPQLALCRCPRPQPAARQARSPPTICSVPKCCRRCRQPMSSSSHHLPANLPNAGIVRGGEHGSFMCGHEASSSMKGCLLGMHLRCVVSVRHSTRDMCSTLPARCADLRGFTRRSTRMYLLCSNASRISHRVLTGSRRQRVCVTPSSRHGCAVPEAAAKGTRAWTALGHREVTK